jgi:hypothetical protein
MSKKKTATSNSFTEAQLADVRRVAAESGFQAFTNEEGRTIYPNEEATDLEILIFDSDCVWLDVYVRDREESIKAEANGTAGTIGELIATMQKK